MKLRLIREDSWMFHVQCTSQLPFENEPWWAFLWPGGYGLTKYILENSRIVQGKSVLEIGSGCGSASIASAMNGATRVLANDVDALAGLALEANAVLNDVEKEKIEFSSENLIGSKPDFFSQFDVILCGDMLYDATFSPVLLRALEQLQTSQVIFGDPGRKFCPKGPSRNEKTLLASFPYHEDGFAEVFVFELKE